MREAWEERKGGVLPGVDKKVDVGVVLPGGAGLVGVFVVDLIVLFPPGD